MPSRRTGAVVAAAALALLLAACGGSSGSAGTTTARAGGGSTTTVAAGAAGKTIDVCTDLPVTDVATITGTKVTAGEPDAIASKVFKCNYTGGLDQIDVDVTIGGGADAYQADYDANAQVLHPAAVTGIGDKAYTTNFASVWLGVLWGDNYFKVDGASNVTVDQAKQLLTALHSKIG